MYVDVDSNTEDSTVAFGQADGKKFHLQYFNILLKKNFVNPSFM